MFPFDNRWQWMLASRPKHLVEATQDHMKRCEEPFRTVMEARAETLLRVAGIRAVVFVLLNIGLLSAASAFLLGFWTLDTDVEAFLGRLFEWISSVSALLLVVFLILTRLIGQLEADLVAALALGATKMGPDTDSRY